MYKNFLLPSSILAGTIIGAGIFALPFVFKSAGFGVGLFYLIIGAITYSFIYLMYADIMLRTKGEHRFLGFSKIYLGKKAFWPTIAIALLNLTLVMGIFLVLSTSFLNLIIPSGSILLKMLFFWIVGSIAIFFPIKRVFLLEFLIVSGMIAIISIIFFLGLGSIGKLGSFNFAFNTENLFLPLGVILFSLSARVAIPSLVNYFKKSKTKESNSLLKKNIIIATFSPVIIYVLFILGIFSLSGTVSPDAVTGLIGNVPNALLIIIGILGFLSLWSTYILVGVNIKNILRHDLKFSTVSRSLFVIILPLIIYFLSSQDFVGLVSLSGGIFWALEGFFIIMIWLKAKQIAGKPSILLPKAGTIAVVISTLVFATALVSEIFNLFK